MHGYWLVNRRDLCSSNIYDEWEENTSLRGPYSMSLGIINTYVATFFNLDSFLTKQDLDLIPLRDNSLQH